MVRGMKEVVVRIRERRRYEELIYTRISLMKQKASGHERVGKSLLADFDI
jgi:hypothetical protein